MKKHLISISTIPALIILLSVPLLALEGASSFFQKSYESEYKGEYKKAIEELEKLSGNDQNYVFHLRIGWLQYLDGNYSESTKAYKKAISADPNSIEAKLGLMLPQMALRLWKDSISTAKKVLAKDSMNYLANSRLAYCYYNLGQFDKAEKAYQKVITSYPTDVDMLSGLAWSKCKQNKMKGATDLFNQILVISPEHAASQTGLDTCK